MSKINLDKIAQDKAREMLECPDKETLERLVTKALGVLQSQGVYAMMLFLFSRTSKENETSPYIKKPLYKALLELPQFKNDSSLKGFCENNENHGDVFKWFSDNITDNMDNLLLVRDLYEQTLIYARFHAKAAQKETFNSGGTP
ncbi:hypothetical protein [Thermodesulfatator autotrophicus]|uniref:CRISPR type III-B/RAMP module-associated protein Cmr5 n=1 Tax=Thermodesulfatator autotrophicus TaxID=1795632 RepID=A0A177EC22_9BACT|nr:hypothetical protein [Thermodesulfatator autotrophicus]OAG28549.1 hypothetical protein TH606_00915 [Thermodesulfatator autotrophicus]